MPRDEIIALKSLDTIQSYKSAYMDIFSRCTDNRNIGLAANELAISTSNMITQMTNAYSMNYYIPENNEEILSLIHDVVRLEKFFKEASWKRIDPLSSILISNIQIGFDIGFSLIVWDEIRKIVRPDITTSIFEGADDETKDMIRAISDKIMPLIRPYVAQGFGSRPLNHGKCERDCTKCPLAQNFTLTSENIETYTKARCPMFLGRQGLLISRIFAQVQVMYRTAFYPIAGAFGLLYETEKKMTNPIKFFNERVLFLNFILDTHFEDLSIEAQANIGFFMSSNTTNFNDIVINFAKGQLPTYIPE